MVVAQHGIIFFFKIYKNYICLEIIFVNHKYICVGMFSVVCVIRVNIPIYVCIFCQFIVVRTSLRVAHIKWFITRTKLANFVYPPSRNTELTPMERSFFSVESALSFDQMFSTQSDTKCPDQYLIKRLHIYLP